MDIDLSLLVTLVASGIARGMIYFLLSCGLTIIFGVLGVVNFAHGAFYMVGFYLTYSIAKEIGFWGALILVPLVNIGVLYALAFTKWPVSSSPQP